MTLNRVKLGRSVTCEITHQQLISVASLLFLLKIFTA